VRPLDAKRKLVLLRRDDRPEPALALRGVWFEIEDGPTVLRGLDLELRDDPMMRLDEFRLMSRPAGRDVTELYAVA